MAVAREQDKRISQALQTGMRNELQEVEGLTAQAIYSSATKAASVGGDFYDLIRLPDRRAHRKRQHAGRPQRDQRPGQDRHRTDGAGGPRRARRGIRPADRHDVEGKMVAALRRLGFDKVFDTDFGAT